MLVFPFMLFFFDSHFVFVSIIYLSRSSIYPFIHHSAIGRSPSQSEAGDDEDESAYRITLPPGCTLEAKLQYLPSHPAEYALELPLYLGGVPGYAPLRRVLHAVAVPARVTLRPSLVEFRERVVFRREMISGSVRLDEPIIDFSGVGWEDFCVPAEFRFDF